ncbi:MAG: glycerophosphoryl diester phosphodiesterase membrane domain-containing protein [Patescibacteria group bacterium]
MSTSSLPRAGELIKQSWQDFIKNWDTTVRVSAWLILASILNSLPTFIPGPQALTITLMILFGITSVIIALLSSMRLYQTTIAILDGKKSVPTKFALAYPLVIPSLIVAVLTTLCVLGGLILLIIPAIFIGVRLSFAQIALIEDNERGTNALKMSWGLTKGHFWEVLWRHIAFGLLLMVIVLPATWFCLWVVGLVSGIDLMSALAEQNPQQAIVQVSDIINSILQAALIPFVTFYMVRLYRAVKKVGSG